MVEAVLHQCTTNNNNRTVEASKYQGKDVERETKIKPSIASRKGKDVAWG